MGFWDNVNDELKKAVEDGWSAVKENARIGKLRFQAHQLHKKAEKEFARLGGLVYEMEKAASIENPLAKESVRSAIAELKKIEAETERLEEEIKKAKAKEA